MFSIISFKKISSLFLSPPPSSAENSHQTHSTSLKVTRAPLQILLSMCLLFDGWCFNILNLNRKRSEQVSWHSQTWIRPRQEKIDATVNFPLSREGNEVWIADQLRLFDGPLLSQRPSAERNFARLFWETFLLLLAALSEPCRRAPAAPARRLQPPPASRAASRASRPWALSSPRPAFTWLPFGPHGVLPQLGSRGCPRSASAQGQGPPGSPWGAAAAAARDSLKALALEGAWSCSTRAGSQSPATALMGFCPFKFYKPVAFLMRGVLFRALNGRCVCERQPAEVAP